jgi:excinuclease ABC subunit A
VVYHVNRLFRQTRSEYTRRWYMSFMRQLPCPTCAGERLCPEARFVTVDGKRLPELTSLSIAATYDWISGLVSRLDEERMQIGAELVEEIRQRLGFLRNVGLHYLNLDRPAPSLSGGEGQRIRLASQIGSGLVGVLYILDEPSIGLHARDGRALLDTLTRLRDRQHGAGGGTRRDTMRRRIDHRPGAGPGILAASWCRRLRRRSQTPPADRALPSGELAYCTNGGTGGIQRQPDDQGARLHNPEVDRCRFLLKILFAYRVSGLASSLIAQTLLRRSAA